MKYTACYANSEMVELTAEEIEYAVRHGVRMRKVSIQRNHKNHENYNPDDKKAMRVQCLGALAEACVFKALGLEIVLTSETFNVEDLPGGVQVRLIGADHYGLRVYPKDDPEWKVVGVVIPVGQERLGKYRIAGWCFAHEAQSNVDWQMAPCGRPPMYCAPQSALHHPDSLRKLIDIDKPQIESTQCPQYTQLRLL